MARPKSEDKRSAIIAAAVSAIAREGLGASTAAIAKRAGVSNGSLFTYFETKADLLNQLYVELKTEMGAAAMNGLPTQGNIRGQLFHMWSRWLLWASNAPDKRRTLAQLEVSHEINAESHRAASEALAGIRALLELSRANGPLRVASLGFVAALMSGLADATIDCIINEPDNAQKYNDAGFDALWRLVG